MVRKLTIIFTAMLLIFSACGKGTNSTALDTTVPDLTSPADSVQKIADQVGNLSDSTDDPDQKAALQDAASALNQVLAGYGPLKPGASLDQVQQSLAALANGKKALADVIQELVDANLPALAAALAELASKDDVLRFYNGSIGRHLTARGLPQSDQGGYKFEGIVFRVYRAVRNECSTALYNCTYQPTNGVPVDNYIALSPDCNGGNPQGLLGYICGGQSANATKLLYREYKDADHMATINQEEVQSLQGQGWLIEGPLGYTPN